MSIKTTGMKNVLATAYGAQAYDARLYTTVPGAAAGTSVVGGTYSPKVITWSTAANGAVTATVVFNVPAGQTIAGAGVHDNSGVYLDGGALASQPFGTDGTYTLDLTFTQV